MQITIYSDYAFRVLIYLGINQKRAQISEIAERYQISFNHLTKTVHHLVRLGHITSYQGKGGGIELAIPPHKINLRKVLEDCEQNMAIVECMGPGDTCNITPACLLKTIMKKAREAFLKELEQFTLADILSHKNSELKKILTSVEG